MLTRTFLVASLVVASAVASFSSNFSAVLQAPDGDAYLAVYNDSGALQHTSTFHWTFQWPLVEASVDLAQKRINLITFPTNTGEATLFGYDFNLSKRVAVDASAGLQYFDLEYSPKQNTYYGIAVISRYGRMLSHFTNFTSPVAHTPIEALPYMWYVNASTLDPESSTYFGLLNNFPGFSNSTNAQKLAVGNYRDIQAPTTTFVDLVANTNSTSESSLIRFISWVERKGALYGFANVGSNTEVVKIDHVSGEYTTVVTIPNAVAQPSFASKWEPVLFAFAAVPTTGGRVFLRIDLDRGSFTQLAEYNDGRIVAAVARLD